ncbi:hypothetical protein J5X98_24660 [Leptothermofonsia sichuanensis E412]|uniref:hypothetical protein n=1 Tax=Leptothermofonsia sichuanensis TaxID=2917832 RepID=UPI001CA717B5|nr:hypothetical protein [Leptothermofonsia sichuanensis]QZZ23820.1 hypothetical protein J5X98_24660 [Leptothermofonsia sichuanensis E412]
MVGRVSWGGRGGLLWYIAQVLNRDYDLTTILGTGYRVWYFILHPTLCKRQATRNLG